MRMPKRTIWLEGRFKEHLRGYPASEKAIGRLAGKNCSYAELILLLRFACNPDRKRTINSFLEEFVPSKQRAKEVAQSLKSAAEELRFFACSPLGAASLAVYEFAEEFSTAGAAPSPEIWTRWAEDTARNPRLLAEAMDQQAQILRRWAESPLAVASTRGFNYRKLWKHVKFSPM
jgi:hypothetical protein